MGTDHTPPDVADTGMGSLTGELLGAVARAPDIPLAWMGPPELRPGEVVAGCFEIERVVGQGGMGVVYLARDRDLDRRVGLKLHRRGRSEDALPSMLAEAKAMAKVEHGNVVSVHMVGTHHDALFIAMEYCSKGTLRQWLREERRSTTQVLDMFTAVGEGLAAAHRAGIVHRDFKPDNVLLAEDGQPRVADFGLAVGDASENATPETADAAGTPAYMPPEQHASGTIDARTDQFAFCVALYEGLTARRPFDPSDDRIANAPSEEVRRDRWRAIVEAGPERAIPGVPAGVARAVRRGLSADPADRFPTMEALLAALRRARNPRLRTLGAVGGLAVVGSGLWAATAATEPAAARCDAANRLDGIWGAPQRDRLARSSAEAPAYEREAWSSLAESLDDYAD